MLEIGSSLAFKIMASLDKCTVFDKMSLIFSLKVRACWRGSWDAFCPTNTQAPEPCCPLLHSLWLYSIHIQCIIPDTQDIKMQPRGENSLFLWGKQVFQGGGLAYQSVCRVWLWELLEKENVLRWNVIPCVLLLRQNSRHNQLGEKTLSPIRQLLVATNTGEPLTTPLCISDHAGNCGSQVL